MASINTHMRSLGLLLAFVLLMCMVAPAQSGHSQNNGTCDDDILHWSNMIEKRTDAPLYAKSKDMAQLAKKATSVWQCENFMHEAIRMIKKPYHTE